MSDTANNEVQIGIILAKLDSVFERLGEVKENSNTRFDQVDKKIERIVELVNEQEKVSIKHGIMIRGCRSKIKGIDTTLSKHLQYHEGKDIVETTDKANTKIKVGILWGAATLIAAGIITLIFNILKGVIHIG